MRRAALTMLLGGAIVWACRSTPPGAATVFPDAPVVLISIDTLRADHLPLYGYTAGSTPNIDRLGREGIVFDDLYSHCPLTLPAHASMLTGLLPSHHGVRDNIGFRLGPDHATLATRFHAAGLRTGAAVSAYVLRASTGIAQGFDSYDDAIEVEGGTESMGNLQRDGAAAVDSLARWISGQKGARFFAFLHLYEPHRPRNAAAPPPGHASPTTARSPTRTSSWAAHRVAGGERTYDRAIVVVTSDHGEGLGEHGEAEHGIFLYRESVHVPLVLRLPAPRGRTRVAGTVAQADCRPTLLELAGQGGRADGALRRALLPAPPPPAIPSTPRRSTRVTTSAGARLFAATDGRYRYVRAPRPGLRPFERQVRAAQPRRRADQRGRSHESLAGAAGRGRRRVGAGRGAERRAREAAGPWLRGHGQCPPGRRRAP